MKLFSLLFVLLDLAPISPFQGLGLHLLYVVLAVAVIVIAVGLIIKNLLRKQQQSDAASARGREGEPEDDAARK